MAYLLHPAFLNLYVTEITGLQKYSNKTPPFLKVIPDTCRY